MAMKILIGDDTKYIEQINNFTNELHGPRKSKGADHALPTIHMQISKCKLCMLTKVRPMWTQVHEGGHEGEQILHADKGVSNVNAQARWSVLTH